MTVPVARTTGAVSTDATLVSAHGRLVYVETSDCIVSLYDGTSTSGNLLTSLSSGVTREFRVPVDFSSLYIDFESTGNAVVHYG